MHPAAYARPLRAPYTATLAWIFGSVTSTCTRTCCTDAPAHDASWPLCKANCRGNVYRANWNLCHQHLQARARTPLAPRIQPLFAGCTPPVVFVVASRTIAARHQSLSLASRTCLHRTHPLSCQ
ncbi:hypothetical protein C2E23DRAFT_832481 [Lenzites betulinus]|nr:hypothetical protein C2E23DRAFT_832481 [Lenzites betulinus]